VPGVLISTCFLRLPLQTEGGTYEEHILNGLRSVHDRNGLHVLLRGHRAATGISVLERWDAGLMS
jgi:hypothetical protein